MSQEKFCALYAACHNRQGLVAGFPAESSDSCSVRRHQRMSLLLRLRQRTLQHARLVERSQTARYFLGVLAAVKGGNTKVAFSLRTKASTGGDDHI
jgi:hypothetical protein